MKPPFRSLRALGLGACVLLPDRLWACATCFGQSDDAMARGMNMGILSLLLVVGFVLCGFAAFGIFLARRAAQFPIVSPSTDEAQAHPATGPLSAETRHQT